MNQGVWYALCIGPIQTAIQKHKLERDSIL